MSMRYFILILITTAFTLAGTACSDSFTQNNTSTSNKETTRMGLFKSAPKPGDDSVPEGDHVKITTKDGEIMIELYPDSAPNTVANFKALIAKGFYDGLTFHRVIPGFVAQGGDPRGDGTGGPGYKVKAEFNERKHLRGTLSMARSSDPDSAGSQFYICLEPQPHLDRQYTIFGQVTEGMDVVDAIRVGTKMDKLEVLP